jgi:Terpene synthase family 2, C-terminal metal binding
MTAQLSSALAADSRCADELDYLEATLAPAFDRFPPRRSPHEPIARAHVLDWVTANALVPDAATADRFREADFPGFVAATYPEADPCALALVTDWFAWLFLLDDTLDDGPTGRDGALANALMSALAGVIASRSEGAVGIPLADALTDLWLRTTAVATPGWIDRFVGHMVAGIAAAEWETANRTAERVPTPSRYVEQRRHTGAIYVCMDLIDIVRGLDVGPDLYDGELLQQSLDAACDVVCWTNDLYSLDKETRLGEYHNLVSVVAHHHGLRRPAAVAHVAHRVVMRLEQYSSAERLLLAEVEDRATVEPLLDGMRSWMRGNYDWSRCTRRYRDAAGRSDA